MKIRIPERETQVPEGSRCEKWGVSDRERCGNLKTEKDYISDREAQYCGIGVSGGSIFRYYCTVFNTYLGDKIAYGVKKCDECLKLANH